MGLRQEGDRPVSDVENTEKGPDAIVEQRGHTLILTLNRPEARNALSTEMLSIMVEAWDRVDNDPEIRSCILTGA
ncbi:MAG: enoyl-CoA hydratase, partial [Mycobacterium sp.]|nr:enoyl-CoA hydratase [Mycobacterium sp.]